MAAFGCASHDGNRFVRIDHRVVAQHDKSLMAAFWAHGLDPHGKEELIQKSSLVFIPHRSDPPFTVNLTAFLSSANTTVFIGQCVASRPAAAPAREMQHNICKKSGHSKKPAESAGFLCSKSCLTGR
ncbi:hypothetical protein [Paracandidimonas soli]|uniref:hypothetical protein n=1 Tax=Paracandidimonas soli TaxID=1917182 RepID=UPI001404D25D|nr:hypothetical protein [Paracandidimonas soli]